MATDSTSGFGATLEYTDVAQDYSSASYTKLAQVTDIPLPGLEADEYEVSNQDSPTLANGAPVKEYVASWVDGGEIETEQIYAKENFSELYSLLTVTKHWKITLADGSDVQFDGYVKKVGGTSSLTDAVKVAVTMRVSGVSTFTAATTGT